MPDITFDTAAAAASIRAGGIVICPTEGVYGLSCSAACIPAVRRILELKERDVCMGLILIAPDAEALGEVVDWQQVRGRGATLMQRLWPGPFTFIVPAGQGLAAELCGGRSTVAVRVSAFPVLRELCRQSGALLISTSANISGEPAVSEFSRLDPRILNGTDVALALPCDGLEAPTAIYDTLTDTLIRNGPGWPD